MHTERTAIDVILPELSPGSRVIEGLPLFAVLLFALTLLSLSLTGVTASLIHDVLAAGIPAEGSHATTLKPERLTMVRLLLVADVTVAV